MNNGLLALIFLLAILLIMLIWYIAYIAYHGLKGIIEGFRSKKDYMLFKDFKRTFNKERYIPKEKRKMLLNLAKNRLKI